jgi:hypothetical protein
MCDEGVTFSHAHAICGDVLFGKNVVLEDSSNNIFGGGGRASEKAGRGGVSVVLQIWTAVAAEDSCVHLRY